MRTIEYCRAFYVAHNTGFWLLWLLLDSLRLTFHCSAIFESFSSFPIQNTVLNQRDYGRPRLRRCLAVVLDTGNGYGPFACVCSAAQSLLLFTVLVTTNVILSSSLFHAVAVCTARFHSHAAYLDGPSFAFTVTALHAERASNAVSPTMLDVLAQVRASGLSYIFLTVVEVCLRAYFLHILDLREIRTH